MCKEAALLATTSSDRTLTDELGQRSTGRPKAHAKLYAQDLLKWLPNHSAPGCMNVCAAASAAAPARWMDHHHQPS